MPDDSIDTRLDPATRRDYTSPTNIAGLLWSVVAAGDLGLLDEAGCRERLRATLDALLAMERHEDSGMFFAWYASATGHPRGSPRARGRRLNPFVSSVDNAWLAAGLMVVRGATGLDPDLRDRAGAVLRGMDFGVFLDPVCQVLRGGYWLRPTRAPGVRDGYLPGMAPVHYTGHHYGLAVSETRLASYVGVALRKLPAEHLAALAAPPIGYHGRVLPASFGGSLFEALAPAVLVPEDAWAPRWWGPVHWHTVWAHRRHAADRDWPCWGLSPCATPGGGYAAFGVAGLALPGGGYRDTWRGSGIVAPYAGALALGVDPAAAVSNLAALAGLPGGYGPGGFADAVALASGRTAGRHLCLDQSLLLAALTNRLREGVLRRHFSSGVAAVSDGADHLARAIATCWDHSPSHGYPAPMR